MPDPENGSRVVRRRSRRHRRNRFIRRCLVLTVMALLVASASVVAMRYLNLTLFRAQNLDPIPVVHHAAGLFDQSTPLNQVLSEPQRPVYPYSVVPGGVQDVKELKWVAEHDPVVAAHYAGFDYARAQVVRLTLARTAYVSYRIGNHIYWTRHRLTLKKGEKLITDGHITARTRCANRVEETPQEQPASPSEPTAEKFDQPEQGGQGTATQSPAVPYQSALLNRPQVAAPGAAGPMALYDPFVGGAFIPVAVPPVPEGLCTPVKKKGGQTEIAMASPKKKVPGPCGAGAGGGMGTTPEPGTWVLFITGLAFIGWRFRGRMWSA